MQILGFIAAGILSFIVFTQMLQFLVYVCATSFYKAQEKYKATPHIDLHILQPDDEGDGEPVVVAFGKNASMFGRSKDRGEK
jgi:hypothetical protein